MRKRWGAALAGHRSGVHGLQLKRERERESGSDAVSAASLAGAVGIQRMGGEDAHADQGEDSC